MPPYSKTTWVDGSLPAIDASKLNKIEQGIFDSLRQDGSTTMSGQLVTTAGSASTPAIAPTGDANTGIFFPAADTIAFGEGGTEAMRINSSANVGIGTISPTYKLHVNESDTAVGSSNFVGLTSQSGGVFAIGVSDKSLANPIWNITTGSNEQLAFLVGVTEKMRIDGSGNVGIGKTSLTHRLEVSNSSAGETFVRFENSNTIANVSSSILLSTNTNSGSAVSSVIQSFAENATGSTALIFRTASSGTGSEKMRIDSNGYVSIGATSAGAAKLRVEDASSAKIYSVRTGGATLLIEGGSASGFVKTITNSNLNLGANNTDYMTITTAGNVGIGTTSTNTNLHVKGAGSTTWGGTPQFGVQATDANNTRLWLSATATATYIGGGGSTTNPPIIFTNDGATEYMRITSAGNVGIGTTSPSVEFHVKGSGEIARIETTTARGSGANYLSFYDPSGLKGVVGFSTSFDEFRIINNVNADMQFYTNGSARLMIEAGGTTRPSSNNTFDLGSATYRWATIYAQNALNTSDARLKTEVEPSSLGLDFISALNPVQYKWIEGGNTVEKVQTGTETIEISPAIPAQPEVLDEEGNVIQEAKEEVPAVTEERPVYKEVVTPREGVRTHFGLIAQEVKAALPDGLDFAGWCLADKDDADSTQSLGYTQLIAPMIKAIQELKAEIEALKAQLNK